MKKTLIFVLLAIFAVMATDAVTQWGRKTVALHWAHFDPGSSDTDSTTRIVFNNDTIWADSNYGDTTWKQISGTVDSCSFPIWLTDESGWNSAIGLQALLMEIDSDRSDSNAVKFRIETRERMTYRSSTGVQRTWSPWVGEGFKSGSGVVDTVQTAITGTAAAHFQKGRFDVSGVQMRLCPEIPTVTASEGKDTLAIDSILYIGR